MRTRLLILIVWCCSASCMLADTITIAMTGDVMMGTTYPKIQLPADSGKHLFADVQAVMQSADITLGNLEGTLCDSGTCTKGKGKYSYAFRTPTGFAPRLTEAGYDFMSMANNHANDFGLEGIVSSERCLKEQDIAYAGILGRQAWTVVERGGIRFGICAFGHNRYTYKHRDLQRVKQILDTLQTMSDIVIVSFHGGGEGIEYSHLPEGPESYIGEDRGDLRTFAHFCIDNGADVIYGHGPHVTRCIEVYKGRFIAYSLGNFCTPYGVSLESVKGYAPVVTIQINEQGEFIEGKVHSFIQQRGLGPIRDAADKVAKHMRQLTITDMPYSEAYIDLDGQIIRHTVKIPSPTLFLQ